jgi:hypothetical protein
MRSRIRWILILSIVGFSFICIILCNLKYESSKSINEKFKETLLCFNKSLHKSIVAVVLEDGEISELELKNLEVLSNTNYTIQKFVIENKLLENSDWDNDLISNENEAIIGTNPIAKDEFYVVDDLFNLPEIVDGIDSKELKAIKRIVELENSKDKEILKGLELIDKYGIPFPVQNSTPNYNTQLEVLFWLAKERNLDYKKLALALALDYGVVVTCGNSEVITKVKKYVIELYDHVKRVDVFLEGNKLNWRAKDYPLEANMLLVWGTCGARYPTFYDKEAKDPWTVFWYDVFDERKMSLDDFEWLFISFGTLDEEKEWIRKFLSDNISKIADSIDSYTSIHLEYYTDKPGITSDFVEVEGKLMKCRISNPDWQWNSLKSGRIKGNCEDVCYANVMLLKSLNIPACCINVRSGDFGHFVVAYYDGTLKTTPNQLRILEEHCKGGAIYRLHQIPWDNFHNPRPLLIIGQDSDAKFLEKGISIGVISKI